MNQPSLIFTDIDYDRDGKQVSFLHLPQSPHTYAWGTIPIPVAVIKNGTGPTVLPSACRTGTCEVASVPKPMAVVRQATSSEATVRGSRSSRTWLSRRR